MKKYVSVFVLATVIAGGVSALPPFRLRAGTGGYFTNDFGGGYEYQGITVKMPYAGGGGFVFIDATYAEYTFGIFGAGMGVGTTFQSGAGVSPNPNDSEIVSLMGFDFGLLLKYPIAVNDTFSFFPLCGAGFRLMLSAEDQMGRQRVHHQSGIHPPGYLSALWFKLGGGVDYHFTDHIFLRGEVLGGFRLVNGLESDTIDYHDPYAIGLFGYGLDAKLAIGDRF